MSKTKIGIFSVLALGVMMLLIPATSIASADEYDKYGKVNNEYYKKDTYYGNEYEKYVNYDYEDDRYYEDKYLNYDYEEAYKDKPAIIIKNKIPPPMKDKDIVCKDTGLIVDDRKNCPFKCQEGLFEGFYVMDKKQCDVTIEDTKSEMEICETCLLTAIDRTNNNVRNNLIDVLTPADANPNIWDICSAEDPTIPFDRIINAGPGNPTNRALASDTFENCLLSGEVLEPIR